MLNPFFFACHFSPLKFSGGQPFGKICKTLSNFEIRRDVTHGKLHASLRVTRKHAWFAAIPYTTRTFYGNSPQIQ